MTDFRKRYQYYYADIEKLLSFVVPSDASDYAVMVNETGSMPDVEKSFREARQRVGEHGRLIVVFHNYLWEPLFVLLQRLRIKASPGTQNWLSPNDVKNLLYLADFEVVRSGRRMLCPIYVPFVSGMLNTLGRLPLINRLCVTQYLIARPIPKQAKELSVSIIVPARNERGNIEEIVRRTPDFGKKQEIIFVENNSTDGTWEEVQRVAALYRGKKEVVAIRYSATGKADAVRKGFAAARNDLLMILDADMTVAPEDLPRFHRVAEDGKGDFINGSRLVYPMERDAMRFLNTLGNKFFATLISWLLDQSIKDTLCGTKVLLKTDYERIAAHRDYFGDFDRFGDFDLLFGAAKQNLKIIDLPIRYYARTYGDTKMKRFSNGWLFLRMCIFAARKIKFT
ncbi:hypothetical protein A3G63_02370 [Candidatus Kaiserbacteria bacterium RIFCSPLOWO2_12_FULL_52_8]|uniref:Glycosyltransferase 2-like domain-containing protein n=1 Tax=Candidatus Kaiserbacteria bacterium RIFCSPHIGHO2_01_FULL_53_31 TaxID=1798481 RepID=A0A1F6CG73_9BACT|nr:MAG: hypothetical protein A2678_01460 [Candidatus Kaiserbacteria bacterium RIFCSPHIGHO2_01_FULL_53_31]OGG93879.1 MAG: hypothetical protein A3G63_02370 [Candidatus Kaiserbacteria bacterium RIFCSPLOWO2_12_FULL_52_8]